MSFVRPTFQPQNPAINGYYLGWASCTCYAGAMAASYDRQVKKITTGEDVRRRTGDTSGGTTLAQVDSAVRSLTGVDLDVYYRLPWASFQKRVAAGQGAILQGWYAPIADSRFDAGNGFRGNHAVFVPPDAHAMDPLADGRYAGVYKYRNEPYPWALLRSFAGKLNTAATGYRPLGDGYVYAAFTKDRVSTYALHFDGGQKFFVYQLGPDGRITGRTEHAAYSQDTSAPCSMPIFYAWPGYSGRMLVRMLAGGLRGEYIDPNQSATSLEEYP